MLRILFVIDLGFWRQGLTLLAGLEIAGSPPVSAFRVLGFRHDYTWGILCGLPGVAVWPLKSLLYPLTWCLVLGVRLFSAHGSASSRIIKLTRCSFVCYLQCIFTAQEEKMFFLLLHHVV